MMDRDVARLTGRPQGSVAIERNRRGIASAWKGAPRPHLQKDTLALNGEAIRARRLELGLLQGEAARRMGLLGSRFSSFETGRIPRVERATLLRIARALECEPEQLLAP